MSNSSDNPGNEGVDANKRMAESAALEQKYRILYENNPSMNFISNTQGKILSANRFGAEQLGYTTAELEGFDGLDLVYVDDKPASQEYLAACFDNPESVVQTEIRKLHKSGRIIWVKETSRATKDENGTVILLTVSDDVTEERELHEQLSYQASHDSLTNLVNRRGFEHRLRWLLNSPYIEAVEHTLGYFDFDHFSVVNDVCGHAAGDALMRQLAELLRGHVKRRDMLARLGGDEFGILMECCAVEPAGRVAKELFDAVQSFRFHWQDKSFSLGVSIGLASTLSGDNIEGLLEKAHTACHAAKEQGGNRIHVYEEHDTTIATREKEVQWVARINEALDAQGFVLYSQTIAPIASAPESKEHYELLIRMLDKDGGTVPPGLFLPAAERYKLAPKIDHWVINAAMDWLIDNPTQLERLELCSINLSGLSLGLDEFLGFVVERVKEENISPDKLCFEITETAAIADIESAQRFINTLKDLGCKFALDDFGAGLSSFGYLKHLPVDFLKIDGMFVKNMMNDEIDAAMVKSINDIGQVMGMKTIAEFVEDDDILAKLRSIGVDYAQGYGISRPKLLGED